MKTLFPIETQYRVLTLWQPWASLLVHGIKKIETRPKPTTWTAEKGVYLIHTAQKWSRELYEICIQEPFKSELIKLGFIHKLQIPLETKRGLLEYSVNFPMGQIIGAIEIESCKPIYVNGYSPYYHLLFNHKVSREYIIEPERSLGDYDYGRFAWLTQNPRILKTPIPYKGGQGYYQKFKGDINQLELI